MKRPALPILFVCVAALTASRAALGGDPPPQNPPAPPDKGPAAGPDAGAPDALVLAKDLFRQGVTLFTAGDAERALDLFTRSRAAFPSAKNTTNAAICLDRLGRYDEALELYEEVLVRFAADLGPEDRAALTPAMEALRRKVGRMDVSTNVEGASLVVDGRPRGKLPSTTALRALPGRRLVRVLKNGYVTFEASVDVKVGETRTVDAKLAPLASAGLLRVEDPGLADSEVFVDRVSMGTTPWEGTIGPGSHVVWARKGDIGSAPTTAIVVQGQAALVRLRSSALGPPTRVEVEPITAHLSIDGVDLGAGPWDGRLPAGSHTLLVAEEGFRPRTIPLALGAATTAPVTLRAKLEIDPNHPRWPKAQRGELRVEVFGGYSLSPSLGGAAQSGCPDACTSSPLAGGPIVGARGGYRFPFGLALELAGGYMSLAAKVSRTVTSTYGTSQQYTASYALDDAIALRGPFAAAGISYRLGSRLGLIPRLNVGVLFASSRDAVSGTGSAGGQSLPVSIADSGGVVRSAAVFVGPELAADVRLGAFRLGAAVSFRFFLTDGPALPNGSISVSPASCNGNPALIGCAAQSDAVKGERAYGRFTVISPELSLGYAF